MLWLLAGTLRPTEFGINKGQTRLGLTENVSVLETIRDLLILNCLPPDTAIDVLSGKTNGYKGQGSGESRVPRDRISNLPRDASFPSRVLYKSQDHQKEFDLSLFTFNPDFLRQDTRSPGAGLTISEAADILASGLLMIEVRAKALTPLEADQKFEELAIAIRKDFLGKDVDWRQESLIRTLPFTRAMLIHFLTTVVSAKTSISSVPPPPTFSLGEIWWERIK
jgi:hypothetical protein